MARFDSVREAKEFLVGKIVEESQREGIALSEVEVKMLYFSETGWTLAEMSQVNEVFDLDYNQAEYEKKIVGLSRRFRKYARQRSSSNLKLWDEAVRLLRQEDHYLSVMVDTASSPESVKQQEPREGERHRLAKLVAIGGAGFIACAVLLMIYIWLRY